MVTVSPWVQCKCTVRLDKKALDDNALNKFRLSSNISLSVTSCTDKFGQEVIKVEVLNSLPLLFYSATENNTTVITRDLHCSFAYG